LIFAGGAGKNEMRIFDFESGNIVCIVSDIEKSIMCMDTANKSNAFAFGAGDSCVRIMDINE
jgi:WD40 repeat protein